MKIHFFVFFCFLLFFCVFTTPTVALEYQKAQVITATGVAIEVEVADTPQKRQLGLGFRDYLAPKEGMLFVFQQRKEQHFWMKNMLIPIDIIWIDNYRIIHIEEFVSPPQQNEKPPILGSHGKKSNFVLELAAGQVKELSLRTGQSVEYRF